MGMGGNYQIDMDGYRSIDYTTVTVQLVNVDRLLTCQNIMDSIPSMKTFKPFFSTSLLFSLSLSLWNGHLKLPTLSGMLGTSQA